MALAVRPVAWVKIAASAAESRSPTKIPIRSVSLEGGLEALMRSPIPMANEPHIKPTVWATFHFNETVEYGSVRPKVMWSMANRLVWP